MPTDSFTSALERLDPASRALLDLSLRRGMRTEEIAEVLGAEPESVEATRDEALQRIASDVGIEHLDDVRAQLAELPADEWLGSPRTNGNHVAEKPAPVAEPPAAEKRRRRLWPMLLGLLAIIGVIVAIALATSDSSDNSKPAKGTPAAPAEASQAKLTPVGAAGASGSADVSDGTLKLTAGGLPPAHYEVWLYNSILDAQSLGTANGSKISVTRKLPDGWTRYRFVDVSREPQDGNPSHSGQSVLRVPTKSLR